MQLRINLAPKEIQQKELERKIELGVTAFFLLVILVAGGIYLKRLSTLKAIESDLAAVERELTIQAELVAQVDSLEAQKNRLTARLNVIKKLLKDALIYPQYIEDLASRIPDSIWLNDFSPTRNGAVFSLDASGTAVDPFAVAELMVILEKAGYKNVLFRGLNIVKNESSGAEVVQFSLSCDYPIPAGN